jgi:hypothetical protein
MGFITRIGQAFSGLTNPSKLTVPVTTATIGPGSLLVAIGSGTSSAATVSSVTDTQGNTYVHDASATGQAATLRNAELWRCANLKPLRVYDPVTGTGDQITIILSAAEIRGIAAIIDQFTGLTAPGSVTSISMGPLQNSFKLAGLIGPADVVSYTVIMPDFTVNWINQPDGYQTTGPAVMPAGGCSLQTAYGTGDPLTGDLTNGPVTVDWSWGPEAHSFAVILANYPAAPAVADQAAETDAIAVTVSQQIYSGPLAPQTSLYSGASTFAHNESNFSVLVTPTITYTWACWLWMAYPLDQPCSCQINWYGASGYISSTGSPGVQSASPVLAVASGAAVAGATHATVSSILIGGTGAGVPSPSHSYFAAAALPQGVNWLGAAAPANVAWASVGGAVVATLADWWPNYGPQNEIGACLDGFSVRQELIV